MLTNTKFILTGGPGAGKTTSLVRLERAGFMCVHESARQIIAERKAAGLAPRPTPSEFASQIFARDTANYDRIQDEGKPTFFDRGIVDGLGMLAESGVIGLADVRAELQARPLNRTVFFFPPWESIYATDAERDQTFEQALRIAVQIENWYRELGFTLVEVPPMSVDDRHTFILNALGRR